MHVGRIEMLRRFVVGIVLVVALLLSIDLQASHIIGGDVSMHAVGTTPGLFRLQLNQYWDATKLVPASLGSAGNEDASVTLLIYRKQNPVLIERVTLNLQETLPLTFDNAACATLQQLSFTQARYYTNYQFKTSLYTDPGGYYMVWERCCRNDALTNIDASVASGVAMTFYLEFPPMLKNGVNFTNSAPEFGTPNGDYICINKLFTFDAGATDADGDQLRYSLVTPLNGYTTRTMPTETDVTAKSSYPTITWKAGYSLTNIIPGNPPLSINATTGMLSVRASAQGLYLFTVQCEEYRNGVLIGVVRRDFQLPVIDCSKNTPPPAVVMTNGKLTSSINWCGSQPVVLSVTKNPLWSYQWQKDGDNLRGSTTDTLQVHSSGVYTVVKSLANACANDTTSQAVKVTFVPPPPVSLTIISPKPYCTGDTVTLLATGQSGYHYHWQLNGKDIAGQQQPRLRAYQSGEYTVLARPDTAVCDGEDSIRVTISPYPLAQIKAPILSFCADDSIMFTAANEGGDTYIWLQNGTKLANTTTQLIVSQAGIYQVTVTGPTGCTARSDKVTATEYARPVVQWDSISPVCLAGTTPAALMGQPAGGTYTGAGVQGNRFDPTVAGLGMHELTYTVTSDKGCQTEQSRWVDVLASPILTGQTIYWLAKGNSIQLLTKANQPISKYQWEPPASLNQTDVASPVASPTETTPYEVTAISTAGCSTTLSILVNVSEPLYIPSAFSPNADGTNDSWILPNISAFPQCEVSIYNRWGELIFFSKGYAHPWDGTYHQERVQTGVYTYQILTGTDPLAVTYRGQLMVVH